MSASLAGASSVMCASDRASRSRSKAGVAITASPSQLTLRTSMRWQDGGGIKLFSFGKLLFAALAGFGFHRDRRQRLFAGFPTVVNPKPIGGVAENGLLERAVDVAHDGFRRTQLAVFANGDFVADFNAPMAETGAETERGVEREIETEGKDGRRFGRGAILSEKRNAQTSIA